jgi:hypothetical protein
MPTNVSISEYCQNPSQYANTPGLDAATKKYWSHLCELRKKVANQKMPSGTSLGQGTEQGIGEFIQVMTSPKSLEFMGAIMGTVFFYKQIKKVTLNFLKKGAEKGSTDAAAEFVSEGGSEAAANGAVITDGLATNLAMADAAGDVAEVAADEATEDTGKYAVEYLFDAADMLGEVASYAGAVLMVLQLVGMILDAWDPCHLNDELTAAQLKTFTDAFNSNFRSAIMGSIDATRDSYGHTILTTIWPIQYYADRSVLVHAREQHYQPIRAVLMMKYVNTLQFNSDGRKINWPKGGNIVDNSTLAKLERTFSLVFADQNTVVANWFFKWWPILLLVLVFIIILFLFIKNRQNG